MTWAACWTMGWLSAAGLVRLFSFFTWYFHLHLRKDTYEESLLILTTLQEPLLCMRASAQLQILGTICYLVAACDARTHAVAAGIRRI